MSEVKNLDEKDRKILEELYRNSRISYSELAKKIGISDVAVIKRVKKLEEQGIIKRYTIVIDPSKLGYKSISFTGINVDPQKLFNAIEELKKIEEIKYLALTSGDHHLIAVIWGRDQEELSEIHKRISNIDGVEKVYPSILIGKIKGDLCI
jgi:Lrp/AsnC family transcriptional regulator for asnA, asnC and gidA